MYLADVVPFIICQCDSLTNNYYALVTEVPIPVCAENEVLVNNVCEICPDDSKIEEGKCVRCPNGDCNPPQPPDEGCPESYVVFGEDCVKACPEGYEADEEGLCQKK